MAQPDCPRNFLFAPRGVDQQTAADLIRRHDVVFLRGGQGTGKTHVALGTALEMVTNGRYGKIVLIRPFVDAGAGVGYLPGNLEEKVDPWLDGFRDCAAEMVSSRTDDGAWAVVAKLIEAWPLAYMRGRTLRRAVGVLDEAQNCTAEQLDMVLGRLGARSKLLVLGDTAQTDTAAPSPLDATVRALDGLTVEGDDGDTHSVAAYTLYTQHRNALVTAMTKRMAKVRAAFAARPKCVHRHTLRAP